MEMLDTVWNGWVVRHPFAHADHVMVIRATSGNGNDGGVVTLALRESIDIDTGTVAVRNTQHSRTFYDGSHELSEDGD